MFRRTALIVALLCASAVPLNGQVQVGLSVFTGGYLPTADLFDAIEVTDPRIRSPLNLGQKAAFVVGGRLGLWWSRIALEAEGAYALSNADLPDVAAVLGIPDDAPVFFGSINLIYVLYQAPFTPLGLYVSGGGGLVSRGGRFFEGVEGTTDFAGALGVGLRYGLGRQIRLRIDLRDYISTASLPTVQDRIRFVQVDSKLQNDLLATVGLELNFPLAP